jgi:hypothetical protein
LTFNGLHGVISQKIKLFRYSQYNYRDSVDTMLTIVEVGTSSATSSSSKK